MMRSKSFKGWSDQHVKFILYQARAELSLIITPAMLRCRELSCSRRCRAVAIITLSMPSCALIERHKIVHRTAEPP